MSDDKLRETYIKEGWGALAIEAGFDPVNTESSARRAFRHSAEKIAPLVEALEKIAETCGWEGEVAREALEKHRGKA